MCTSRLNDHGRRHGRNKDNRPVVLWEPYNAYPEELREVFDAVEADGLRVHIMGLSPWNPGHTFALLFTATPGMSARADPMARSVVLTRGRVKTERFTRALLDLADQGLRTHCSDPETHHLWLSEEVAERRTATGLAARRSASGAVSTYTSAGAKADRCCGSHHPSSFVTWRPRCCSAP